MACASAAVWATSCPDGAVTSDAFIARWRHADGSELANAQSFLRELCELLSPPPPGGRGLFTPLP